jgi:hypothetical protein
MRRLRLLGVAAALAMAPTMSGCSWACTTIGWANAVNVELDGDTGEVAAVELCADGVCASSAPLLPASDEPLQVMTALPETSATPSSAPTSGALLFSIERIDERTWRITFPAQSPEEVLVRAVSATGEVLAEREATVEWEQVGGSERCGGPSEGRPISLDIPS